MNNILLKLLSFVLFLTIICSLVTGCDTERKIQDNTDAFIVKQEPVTLKFYFYSSTASPINENSKHILDEIEKRVITSLNVKLDFQWISSDIYDREILAKLAAGQAFDAFSIFDNIEYWDPDNNLLDITKLFPENAMNYYKKFSYDELAEASYKGKLMVIPHNIRQSLRKCAAVREDLMTKYNIPDIKNLSDYEVYLKTIKDNEKVIPGTLLSLPSNVFANSFGYEVFDYGFVFKWDDPETKLVPWEQTSAYKEVYSMMKRWYDKGYIAPFKSSGYWCDSLTNGSISSTIAVWPMANELKNAPGVYKFKLYPLDENKIARRVPIIYDAIAFNKNSINYRWAIRLIDWVHSNQENYDLFMYGIQGENYNLADNRLIFNDFSKRYMGWPGSSSFMDYDYERQLKGENTSSDSVSAYVDSNAESSPLELFKSDLSSLGRRDESFTEMERNILNNQFTTSPDSFINGQKDSGIDNIAVMINKELAAWKRNNKNLQK